MTDLYLLEPELLPAWFPFGSSRPICELRASVWLIRERWEAVAGGESKAIFGPEHLRTFAEDNVPPVTAEEPVDGPAIIGRSDFAPAGDNLELPADAARLVNEGDTVGWWVPKGTTWQGTSDESATVVEIEGVVLHGAFDVLTAMEHLLAPDTVDFQHESGDELPAGSMVIGDPGDVVILGALVEPGVTFDVRGGVIVIEQNAYVKGGTRLEGPIYIGPGSEILGGSIHGSVIGPRCKVRGEVSDSVFLGYGNKGHDGFLGHSVVGRWVNLGAGTTTSNLKNTYGPIRLSVGDNDIETGRQFLGTLFGDHAKTAIGTMMSTGATVGTGANVFGYTSAPKYVPEFAWGDTGATMQRDGFLKVAERVMPRRQVEVTEDVRSMLETIYDHAIGG
jgi:UDP-N-acetylglucosamine diphosphorylase/glucosamine-1-phosphate N-acetyltransferase